MISDTYLCVVCLVLHFVVFQTSFRQQYSVDILDLPLFQKQWSGGQDINQSSARYDLVVY